MSTRTAPASSSIVLVAAQLAALVSSMHEIGSAPAAATQETEPELMELMESMQVRSWSEESECHVSAT